MKKYTQRVVLPILTLALLCVVGFAPAPARAAVDMFIKIGDVKGELTDSRAKATVGQTVVLGYSDDTTVRNTDGSTVQWSWRQVSGPYQVKQIWDSRSEISFTPETAGTYAFELVASDGQSDEVVKEVTLEVGQGDDEATPAALLLPAIQKATETDQSGTGQGNAGIEPDEIDYAGDSKTTTSFGVLLGGGDDCDDDCDGDTEKKSGNLVLKRGDATVTLDGLTIDFRDADSDDDGLADAQEADHEAEITLKGVSVRVDAAEVRGWDAETKEVVRARLAENDDKNDANDFGLFVAMQAIDHAGITDIKVTDGEVVVVYKTKLSVFGFISVETATEVRAKGDIDGNTHVETKYPWWSFLARKNTEDQSTMKAVAEKVYGVAQGKVTLLK